MSQFDQTTEKLFREMQDSYDGEDIDLDDIFRDGRNSAKSSMELACLVLKSRAEYFLYNGEPANEEAKAIAEIKAHGNWPLEEK